MNKILLFLVRLLILSLLALPTVPWFEHIYKSILQYGVADTNEIPFIGARTLYLFFALLLATPHVSIKRRCNGIVTGITLYLLIDRLMIPTWKILPYTQKPGPVAAKEFYTNVYYMFMHWMLPFILWFVFAFREIELLFRRVVKNQ